MHIIRVTDTKADEKFFDCLIDKGDSHARWVRRELNKRFPKEEGWKVQMWALVKCDN